MSERHMFSALARCLHWLMAVLILAMLYIGIAMVASLWDYHRLVSIHEPLGMAILLLAALRLAYRLRRPAPPLPDQLPAWQRRAARASHVLLYGLMLAMPLVGWAMQSAAAYPVVLPFGWHLPAIVPHDPMLYAHLRTLHSVLAFTLFAAILGHLGAALMHALILRDGVFDGMAWGRRAQRH